MICLEATTWFSKTRILESGYIAWMVGLRGKKWYFKNCCFLVKQDCIYKSLCKTSRLEVSGFFKISNFWTGILRELSVLEKGWYFKKSLNSWLNKIVFIINCFRNISFGENCVFNKSWIVEPGYCVNAQFWRKVDT